MYKLLIGSHVSLKAPKYLVGSLEESLSYEANAMMIYTGAPQNNIRLPLSKFLIPEFHQLAKEKKFDLNNVIIHAPYIFNPANSVQHEFAVQVLVKEIQRTYEIGSRILVLHPGAHIGEGYEKGIMNSADVISKALKITENLPVTIAIETMAGKGTEICYRFEQLASLMQMINSDRIKVCMDTCHIHDAGYDIINNLDGVLAEFDKLVGLKNVIVMHINDSKNTQGARKDRHENLGNGHIGFETLIKVIYHPAFNNVVKILETPYIDNKPPYKDEIIQIRKNIL